MLLFSTTKLIFVTMKLFFWEKFHCDLKGWKTGRFKSLRFDFCVFNFDTMKFILSAKVLKILVPSHFWQKEMERKYRINTCVLMWWTWGDSLAYVSPPSSRRRATLHQSGSCFVKECFLCCTAPKPPLCKGRWAAERRLGGVVNPSVSFADSSLYTREPFLCRRQIAPHHRLSRWWVSAHLCIRSGRLRYFTKARSSTYIIIWLRMYP